MGKIVRARAGAGAGAGIVYKLEPEPELEPDKNGPAPQHWWYLHKCFLPNSVSAFLCYSTTGLTVYSIVYIIILVSY
jgi:hypothetical protein